MNRQEKLDKLEALNQKAYLGGGVEKIASQHAKNKLTARERIDALLDPGSFEEYDRLKYIVVVILTWINIKSLVMVL